MPFLFLSMYHFQHEELANAREKMQEIKDMTGFLGHLCLIDHHGLLSELGTDSASCGKLGPWDCQLLRLLSLASSPLSTRESH